MTGGTPNRVAVRFISTSPKNADTDEVIGCDTTMNHERGTMTPNLTVRHVWFWLCAALLILSWGRAPVATAQILLQEDFDDGNLAARGWYDIVGWGNELFISTTESRNGTASLEVRYLLGSTGPWMRHQFPGQDRLYTRYYRKWPSTWIWPISFGPHDTYIFAVYGERFFTPTQTYLTVYTDEIYAGPPDWRFGTIGLQHKAALQGRGTQSPASLTPPPPPLERNRWYCIETMATMNTPGSADGRLQLWLDGVLIFDVTGVLLRDSNNPTLQFDTFMFGPYFHDGVPQVQSTWMDALVIATTRVGCLGDDRLAPAAVTNLRLVP